MKEIGIFTEADLPKIARGIIESYHYDTDFLSELLQNAVDAIRRTNRKTGNQIYVEYNSPKGLWTVKDNGTGMSKDDLKLFALGRTDKEDLRSFLIGEKGVGGSYVLLISDYFEVESVKNGQKVRAVCEKARETLFSGKEPKLRIVEEASTTEENYTKIMTRSVWFKSDVKDIEDLEMVLRMFTAAGNTRRALDIDDIDIEIKIAFVGKDQAGNDIRTERTIPWCFWHPSIIYSDRVKTIEQLEEDPNTEKYPDGFYQQYIFDILDKDKRIRATFAREDLRKKDGPCPFLATIVLGVKGAPMPVEISPPKTGYAGYWNNLFVLIERDDVQLDIGRKSITRSDLRQIHEDLAEFFNRKVVPYARLFTPPPKAQLPVFEQLKEQARNKEDLRISKIAYSKIPTRGEELSVCGIFHELIGAGILKGYHTLSESSDAPYDAIVRYSVKISDLPPRAQEVIMEGYRKLKQKPEYYTIEGFVEYKVDAVDFMKDCDRGDKKIEDVMLVVAFDVDRKRIRRGWRIEPIPEEERIFSGAKYKIVNTSLMREVPLILLNEFRFQE
jgi:hypothetical protein